MLKQSAIRLLATLAIAAPAAVPAAEAGDTQAIREELQNLKQRIQELEQKLEAREAACTDCAEQEKLKTSREIAEEKAGEAPQTIKVGGAVRFQYAYRDFSPNQKARDGSFELDTIRLNFDGELGGVLLSAEYRFYEFMDVVHHAWAGYDFSQVWQAQVGFHRVPFGILPYNSNNFFFSSNYYIGYEDDYDAGVKVIGDLEPWNVQLAYYANDEIAFGARNQRYSYDILRDNSGNQLEENNTFNARLAYTLEHGEAASTELGVSGQYGRLADNGDPNTGRAGTGRDVGDNQAYGAHLFGSYDAWSVMLQALRYEYDLDNNDGILGVGAYAFNDAVPAKAYSYTGSLVRDFPVAIGPITNIRAYNDLSYVTDKSAGLPGTWMNVLGAAVSAGGLFTYFDLVWAKNQPFIGGSLAGAGALNANNVFVPAGSGDDEVRFNINFGYYF